MLSSLNRLGRGGRAQPSFLTTTRRFCFDLSPDARFLCFSCYTKENSKGACQSCRRPVLGIRGDPMMENRGQVWHERCFVCTSESRFLSLFFADVDTDLTFCFYSLPLSSYSHLPRITADLRNLLLRSSSSSYDLVSQTTISNHPTIRPSPCLLLSFQGQPRRALHYSHQLSQLSISTTILLHAVHFQQHHSDQLSPSRSLRF